MVRANTSRRADCGVLPSGGKLEAGNRADKTVDKSNALPLFKKKTVDPRGQGSDIFTPADPNSLRPKGHGNKGKELHTDPFAADRPQYVPPTKILRTPVATEPRKVGIMHLNAPEHTPAAHQMISANGIVFNGGKLTSQQRCSTTLDIAQPVKDYASMARFRQKGSSAEPVGTDPITHNPAIVAPPSVGRARGIKQVEHKEQQSLLGVLRSEEKKPARSFNYRPPWGTCNTPRTTTTSRGAQSQASPAPWASTAQ